MLRSLSANNSPRVQRQARVLPTLSKSPTLFEQTGSAGRQMGQNGPMARQDRQVGTAPRVGSHQRTADTSQSIAYAAGPTQSMVGTARLDDTAFKAVPEMGSSPRDVRDHMKFGFEESIGWTVPSGADVTQVIDVARFRNISYDKRQEMQRGSITSLGAIAGQAPSQSLGVFTACRTSSPSEVVSPNATDNSTSLSVVHPSSPVYTRTHSPLHSPLQTPDPQSANSLSPQSASPQSLHAYAHPPVHTTTRNDHTAPLHVTLPYTHTRTRTRTTSVPPPDTDEPLPSMERMPRRNGASTADFVRRSKSHDTTRGLSSLLLPAHARTRSPSPVYNAQVHDGNHGNSSSGSESEAVNIHLGVSAEYLNSPRRSLTQTAPAPSELSDVLHLPRRVALGSYTGQSAEDGAHSASYSSTTTSPIVPAQTNTSVPVLTPTLVEGNPIPDPQAHGHAQPQAHEQAHTHIHTHTHTQTRDHTQQPTHSANTQLPTHDHPPPHTHHHMQPPPHTLPAAQGYAQAQETTYAQAHAQAQTQPHGQRQPHTRGRLSYRPTIPDYPPTSVPRPSSERCVGGVCYVC
ncbi:hypothetical protein SARC_12641 [Sphaeroforma arctica JP610]|uniref:Uncharacterized protein n=1 Tax=Sphaeroforma arctica JP610 TaxID=667725 RepID=A0A0L0FDI3_9EUKA|nr:hypothetical protein SARC_12641 [Sphaeroforma arctica JP610]KNC74820.1 hypothetical protein SARC_12641 [Sphaeroforma arctica JP610]|eukprot:XP_014148722.1 hypothetical protein SARC_12641 [Sphaeroforma arctica JP610]